MKQLFTLLLATGLLNIATAQTAAPVVKAGTADVVTTNIATNTLSIAEADEMLTLKETEFDFGKIPQGKPVTHILK